jgi:hypothetical protein
MIKKSYRHLIAFLAIGYILMFWGNTEYAQNTKLIPSMLLADLVNLTIIPKLIILSIPAIIAGIEIEFRQIARFKNVKFSKTDVILGLIGIWLSVFLPQSVLILIISIIILISCIVFFKKQIK